MGLSQIEKAFPILHIISIYLDPVFLTFPLLIRDWALFADGGIILMPEWKNERYETKDSSPGHVNT